jgi:hypothetical protein
MADLWLMAWFGGGVVAAYGFAAVAWWHARRNGRRWHEVVLTTQPVGLVMASAWVIAYLLVGPWWALLIAPVGVMVGLVLTYRLFEWLAQRSVAAREAGS